MKFTCSKSNLLNGVQIVSKAVPNKTTMSILECILINASDNQIKLTANDMELGIETIIDGNVEEEGIITGVFHITGNYKMNEGSINRDEFSFDLPFDITLDPRYDISTVKADIDDFYYDVINSDTLSVNIDLFIEAEYLPEDVTKEEDTLDEKAETEEIEEVRVEKIKVDDVKDDIPVVDEKKEEIMGKIGTEEIKEETRDNDNITASDLFSNLDDSETYTTYYVYIVKEEDTIDKILIKYGITKEAFEDYNDITNIKPGDKVIIPKTSE